jgi:hypothetical protein
MNKVNNKYYAGVGSRETPAEILTIMSRLATKLGHDGWVLRSGHAPGADQAFEKGIVDGLHADIYLPWKKFHSEVHNKNCTYLTMGEPFYHDCYDRVREIVKYLPNYPRGSGHYNIKFHGRNWCQVFGTDNTPVKMVVCYSRIIKGIPQGGTATAIRLAEHHGIPVYNLFYQDIIDRILKYLK